MLEVQPNTSLGKIIGWSREQEASDIHGQVGKPLWIRARGELRQGPAGLFAAATNLEMFALFASDLPASVCAKIEAEKEIDLSFHFQGDRYRANFSRQRGLQSFSFRVVPQQRMVLKDLRLPGSLSEIVKVPRGLVMVTGPTGQGKSTTLRALIQQINEATAMRIVTIEDPIEYEFADARSNIEQREVGVDTDTFAGGIRNAMRQDPDVIVVGEIRDRESIFAAMQAAETGHLVLTTLHADSVAQSISRILEYYPAQEQHSVSAMLSRTVKAIVCQRLLPNTSGGQTPCLEILRQDAGVREAIAGNDLHLLSGIVAVSVHQGMHSFDQYLTELFAAGEITKETVKQNAVNLQKIDMKLRGFESNVGILKPERG